MTDINDCNDNGAPTLPPPKVKNPAAVALGRLGGRAGTGASKRRSKRHYQRAGRAWGKTGAARMTPEQRSERARKANRARLLKRQQRKAEGE